MQNDKPKIIVFASGTKSSGGSGFENLVIQSRENKDVNYEIVAVVSNYENGGVRERADKLGIPFIYFEKPFSAERYSEIIKNSGAQWTALSGWLKLTRGLDPRTTFNIHPGKLPEFGGEGMYGIHVHTAVIKAGASATAVTMHFVTDIYDDGPVFFALPVEVEEDDTAESLSKRVNTKEHEYQPLITSMVANGDISWDGKSANTFKVPEGYRWL
jgi:phosphoribosylglycinamide formyltransferase 1